MAYKSLAQLRVLIVDDFKNFRATLNKMMADFGVSEINSCGSAVEALALCEDNEYDLVLCDYNLGTGKTGQQLLEELRFYSLLPVDTVFLMISADSDRSVVMSTYDCKPDAYLTKPVTTKMLSQRLDRLLSERDEFFDVNAAMSSQQFPQAITLLKEMMETKSGRAIAYQKILARAYLLNEEYDNAEVEYSTILQARRLDWAQVGLANVKFLQGDFSTAASWLEGIVAESPGCIEAFDLLANVCEALGWQEKQQQALQELVELSPMSIARQLKLARAAVANCDFEVAATTYRKAMKSGQHSCYQHRDIHTSYVRAMISVLDQDPLPDVSALAELTEALNNIDALFPAKNSQQKTQQQCQKLLLASQINSQAGEKELAIQQLTEADALLSDTECDSLQIQLDFVSALMANDKREQAQERLEVLVQEHKHNASVYMKIDRLLVEPSLKGHRKYISEYNKKGIGLYKANEFDPAITCFEKVVVRFPNHVGSRVNLLQALLGKLKARGKTALLVKRCQGLFACLSDVVSGEEEQQKRYLQLKNIFQSLPG